jgi:ribonucleoside-diphosphate reductase alpha chain
MKLEFTRYFTKEGLHPFDAIQWKRVDARLHRKDGSIRFEALNIEVPEFWTQQTIDIVAEKYFRVINGVRETSAKQMFTRVAMTIADAGYAQGLFETPADAWTFQMELSHLLVNQMFAFNSPVWFNIGVPGVKQQASACFIQSVEDNMESILKLQSTESMLFKGGSGTGSNLSKLRSSIEKLSNGEWLADLFHLCEATMLGQV